MSSRARLASVAQDEGVGKADAEGLFQGVAPRRRQGDAIRVPSLVPQVGVAGTAPGLIAAGIEAVGVRVGVHADAAQTELLADLGVVGQGEDLLDVGQLRQNR